jgi:archaellum component FlaC
MSNLQLAEMNSELLEEALKRGGEGYVGRMGPVVDHAQYSQGAMGKTGPSSTTIGFPDKQKPIAPTPVRHSLDTAGRYGGAAMSSPFGMGGMRGASISMAIASGANTPASSRPGSRAPSRQGTDGLGHEKVPPRPMSAHPAGSSEERPTMTRRKSSDNALGKSPPLASQAGNQKPAPGLGRSNTTRAVSGAVPTPRRPIATRPGMERSATMGPGSIPNDLSFSESLGSVGSSLGGFFRKNLEKNGPAAGLMRELGLNQLRMPDLRDLPLAMPSPGNMTPRSEFLANSPPTTTGSLGQGGNTPRTIPTMASMLEGGSSAANAAELQKMRATLAQSQTTLKALTNELDTLKKAKSDLESELESLSQALFEEANKMVAEERKKHAKVIEDVRRELRDVKEELDEVRKEREAVKSTMRLLEGERSATPVSEPTEKKDGFLNDRPLDGPAKVQAESDVKSELQAREGRASRN